MEAHARMQSSVTLRSMLMWCPSALPIACLCCVCHSTVSLLLHGLSLHRLKAYDLQVPAASRDRLNPATSPSLAAEFEKVHFLIMHTSAHWCDGTSLRCIYSTLCLAASHAQLHCVCGAGES